MTQTISKNTARDLAYSVGMEPDDALYLNYSGRGMYGRECFGIVGTVSDLVGFVTEAVRRGAVGDETVAGFVQYIEDVSTDNMGLDMIFYWQDVQIAE